MAGFGNTFRKLLNDLIFANTGGWTAPAAGTFYVSLHTGDPGVDGQTANEVSTSGTAYARKATTSADWGTSTTADPAVIANTAALAFATATGSGFGTVTHFGLWRHVSSTTAANFIGSNSLGASQAVAAGNTASFAIGALTHSFDSV